LTTDHGVLTTSSRRRAGQGDFSAALYIRYRQPPTTAAKTGRWKKKIKKNQKNLYSWLARKQESHILMALTLAFSFRPLLFASNPMGGSSNTAGIGVDRCGRLRPLLTHAKTQAVGKVIATKSGKHHTAIKRNA